MGHNAHLSKQSESIQMPASKMWRSIGTHLHADYPQAICSIWLLYDHGEHFAMNPREWEKVESLDGSVEQLLAKSELEPFLLPLTGLGRRYLDEERVFRINAKPTSGRIARQADAIVFFSETRAAGK